MYLIISCKNEIKNDKLVVVDNLVKNQNNTLLKKNTSIVNDSTVKTIDNCNIVLKKFILSSNISNAFLKNFEIEIESIESTKLKIRLFIETPTGENSNTTVGWLIFNAIDKKLLDITNDIEEPEILKFNNVFWNNVVECFFDNNSQFIINEKESTINLTNWNCLDKGGDMNRGFITECLSNSDIKKSYSELKELRNEYFKDGNLLLNILPKKDTIYTKDNVELNYKIINKNKINIILSYAGGMTNFNLIENKGKTKVIKTLFPD